MPTCIGPIPACVPLASPDERGGVSVPANNRVTEPVFEDLYIVDVMARQRSPLNNALHRLGHIEPGASIGSGEQENAMLGTPLGQAWTLVPGQIIPDQQHPDGRKKPVQLVCCWVDVPILPAASFRNHIGGRWALLQDRQEVCFEPGMRDSVGGVFHG